MSVSFRDMMRGRGITLAILAVAAVGVFAAWVRLGQPVPVEDAALDRIPCLSYSPHRGEETPADPSFKVPEGRVAEDMAKLSRLTRCVRTYATAQGGDQVVAEAKKQGMTVILGAWIAVEEKENRGELDRLVHLANAYPETVQAVVVGNEVLLRQEMSPTRLASLITEIKAQVKQPVTYADVWEFWLKYGADLAPAVDFITIHMLPYWENDPTPVEDAVEHIAHVREKMMQAFPGKDILIGEVGWPSAGRQREGAEPSVVNETKFLRALLEKAAHQGWQINLIEAFDQPWKRIKEGTAGGAWGMFDQNRQVKVSLTGPVVERPDWKYWAGASAILGLALALAVASVGRTHPDVLGGAILLLGGLASGGTLGFMALHAWESSRDILEWGVNGVIWALGVASAIGLLSVLCRAEPKPGVGLGWLHRATLTVAAVSALGLMINERYRDFPATMLAIMAVGTVLTILRLGRRDALPEMPEDSWLGAVILAGAVVVPLKEGFANDDALAWAITAAVLALPTVLRRNGPSSAPRQ